MQRFLFSERTPHWGMSFSDCITRSCPVDEIDISQAPFLSILLSNSDILRDTEKQLQLLAYKTVQMQFAIIACSCNFNYRILQLIAIPDLKSTIKRKFQSTDTRWISRGTSYKSRLIHLNILPISFLIQLSDVIFLHYMMSSNSSLNIDMINIIQVLSLS